ncbi:hypothetical protein PCE1_000783 [Barthelona sp. PCE]
MNKTDEQYEMEIRKFRLRKLIKNLSVVRGNGTSLVSLIVNPSDDINKITSLLNKEIAGATAIKSRLTRQSVQSALTSALQNLRNYSCIPPNGLVVYSGQVGDIRGTKRMVISFEPFKPINTSLYVCDSRFHTEDLVCLLESNEKYGFIIMDGHGTLFGLVQGNSRHVIHKFSEELPKKHGRGGQSANRFQRIRMEARHNYMRKVTELATQFFIDNDMPNVNGLIVAGSAEFKVKLTESSMFDYRLVPIILDVVDVGYGGEPGFSQAIERSKELLGNVRYVNEKKIINKFYEHIAKDSGLFVYGVLDTMRAVEAGCVETLIVYEDCEAQIVFNNETEERRYVNDDKAPLEPNETMEPLVDWLIENYSELNCRTEFVSDATSEGTMFAKSYLVGGITRFAVEALALDAWDYVDDDEFDGLEDYFM